MAQWFPVTMVVKVLNVISDNLYHVHLCTVIVPEVAGGTDLIHKVHNALVPAGVERVVWVDALGYDSWPALACMEATQPKSLSMYYILISWLKLQPNI